MSSNLRGLPMGHIISDYRIEGILGQGGFGITYLATDTMLNRRVAIKEYFPREFAVRDSTLTVHSAGDKEDREFFESGRRRFLEEARVLALFDHPNIVGVRRFFEANGTAYLVMDYCDGEPLDEFISRNGPLSNEQLHKLLISILDGLEKIHNANFLHRDIKPANIYIRADGSPVLLDFGAARQELANHSRSVTSFATEGYAAVEQYSTRGKQGPTTDIYGFGATLYRAVTDIKPQGAPDRILHDTLEPCSKVAAGRYDQTLLHGIDAAMGVRPEDRPQSIREWRIILGLESSPVKRVAAENTSQVKIEKTLSPASKQAAEVKKPGGLIYFIAIFIVCILGAAGSYYIYEQTPGSKTSGAIKPALVPEIQGGSTPGVSEESWEKNVQAVLERKRGGKITLSPISSSEVSSDLDALKNSMTQLSALPSSDVAKIEAKNIWFYTKQGKFSIRLINPSMQPIEAVIIRFASDCKVERNVTYASLKFQSPLLPAKEVLYEGSLPLGGKLNLQGYGCAVVQDAYAPLTANINQAPTNQQQSCVGSYSSAWTNCSGTQNFGSDTQWAGQKYVGSFVDGKRHGKGTYSWPNGDKYIGDFKNNSPNGNGVFSWADGASYSGSFKDGMKSGFGTQKWANGTKYVGEYKNDVRDGKGILYAVDGSVISSGNWEGGSFKGASSNSPQKTVSERMNLCTETAKYVNKDQGKVIDSITKLRSAACYTKPNGDVTFIYNYDITSSVNINQASLNRDIRPGRIKKWCDEKDLKAMLDLWSIEDVYFDQNGYTLGKVNFSKADCK